MLSYILTGIFAAQSTDMQYIILFLNISNREIKRRFRSIDIVVGNFAKCQRKLLVHACTIRLPALTRSCAWIGLSSTHHAVLQSKCVWSVPDKRLEERGDNDESLGTKQLSSIIHPLASVRDSFMCCNLNCLQTGIWL